MSLRPEPVGEIPADTARVAGAAFPKGTLITRLRDEFSALYQDEDFRSLYPARGQPGLTPWRLALVTVFQFLEHLSDRQAADVVRARIDWKYALGLELTDPGFHFSVLGEFRARLVAGGAEHLLLDTCWSASRRAAWSRRGASSAPTARTCWPPCMTCTCSNWWPKRSAPRWTTWPRLCRTGCGRSPDPPGSSGMGTGSRIIACPSAEKSVKRSPWRSAWTGSSCSTLWMRRLRRLQHARCRWCRRSATCGGSTTCARGMEDRRAGGPGRSCRRWASGCSHRMIRRRTIASSAD